MGWLLAVYEIPRGLAIIFTIATLLAPVFFCLWLGELIDRINRRK